MQNHILSKPERDFVEKSRRKTREKLMYMKLSILVMLDEGHTQESIAIALGISSGTVSNSKKKYDADGLAKYLDTHYVPYQGKLNEEELVCLENEITAGVYSTSAQVVKWIKETFEIEYSERGVQSILRKLGFVYKKTTAVPCKADFVEQERFLKDLEGFLKEDVVANDVSYFMDAVHPQHNTRSDYAWIKSGEKKLIPTNCGRQRININGAMNALEPEDVVIVEAERINAQSTIALCEKLLLKHLDKDNIYIFCDNARYYSSVLFKEWVAQNPKIQVLFIPPYSPNLNLIERLWKFLRKKVINLTFYPNFKEFREVIHRFFDNIKQYKEELRTLMRPNFQRFSGAPIT